MLSIEQPPPYHTFVGKQLVASMLAKNFEGYVRRMLYL
jgi:hypothetical protein